MTAEALDAPTDDSSLLRAFRTSTGEARTAAFDGIFRAHRVRVLRLCRQLCGDADLAEDALQETFVAIYHGLESFRGDAQLSTWLYRIAVRTALKLRAHAKPRRTDERAPVTATAHPSAALAARDELRRVETALAALPAEQRVVVALFAVEGMDHDAIAAILGVSTGTVWSRLHRARKALVAQVRPSS